MMMEDIPRADPHALARLNRWGGDKLVREIAALFRTEVPVRLVAAWEAVNAGHCAGAEQAAHSLKSSCAQVGAQRMRALAEEVEILSAQGTLAPVSALLDLLNQEFDSFTEWLDAATVSVG